MLSARELNPDLLPENAHTWVNQHLKFTHGSGIVMSPVNAKDTEGLPVFYLKDIPSISKVGLKVDQPGIYYGEEPDNYVVVKTNTPEFDYPRGSDNVFGYYQTDDGIKISGITHRLLFSYYFKDINLLVSDTIQPQSKILIRRNIRDRIARLAPFLVMDRDPYIVLHDGRLAWIIDCYTTSDRFPYSQRNGERNQLHPQRGQGGGRRLHRPHRLLRVRSRRSHHPDLATDLSHAVPAAVRDAGGFAPAHPLSGGHVSDPGGYLRHLPHDRPAGVLQPRGRVGISARKLRRRNRSDAALLRDHAAAQPRHEEYILMLPMVPRGRDNMISWLAAGCDGNHYGHLIEYAFSKDKLIYGPYQIQARINQNPEISRQMSLWNQMGSRVILGNLLVIPIENSLLYVEPLYLRAENGQLPELQRVIASYSDRVVMGDDLDLTLAALFKPGALPKPQIVTAQAPPPVKPACGPFAAGRRARRGLICARPLTITTARSKRCEWATGRDSAPRCKSWERPCRIVTVASNFTLLQGSRANYLGRLRRSALNAFTTAARLVGAKVDAVLSELDRIA